MSNVSKAYIPWREREFLTPEEVGLIFARSSDWARNRASEGELDGVRLLKGGPLVITVQSVAALVARIRNPGALPPALPTLRDYPRLAWVNSNPIN